MKFFVCDEYDTVMELAKERLKDLHTVKPCDCLDVYHAVKCTCGTNTETAIALLQSKTCRKSKKELDKT